MELSPKRNLALCMILAGHTNEQVSSSLGLSMSGIEKIKRDKDFRTSLRRAISDVYERAIAELASGSILAAARLRRIIEDPATSDYHVILASRLLFDILETSRRWEMEARLDRVERLLEGRTDLEQED